MALLAAHATAAPARVSLVGKLWATGCAGFWATSLSTLPASSTVSEVEEEVAVMVAPPAAAHLGADLTICQRQTLAAQEAATPPPPAQPVLVPPPHTLHLLILPTPSQW